jgi:hypothetical protein
MSQPISLTIGEWVPHLKARTTTRILLAVLKSVADRYGRARPLDVCAGCGDGAIERLQHSLNRLGQADPGDG